ncbi:MAG: hypothetical protein CVT79_13965 [Alphaproteobacteria bacterium HGW-Alphaproteobacteria-18]|nr:MAG: hypothetical protein CVT79_13965 [Alphaproteobacteria bacterium HGW-Alphaproteobacteria-18]
MPHGRLLMACLAGLIFAAVAWSEPGAPPGDEVKAVKLEYAERPDKDGRIAAAEFTVSDTPVRYYVRGTNVSAPFSVQVIAASKARPLEVTLHRQSWGKAVQSGSTGREGSFVFEGRAYGDVGVQLVSPDGSPARATLVLWEGVPAPPDLARVYINPEMAAGDQAGFPGRQSGGTSPILYVIAGLLAVIVVFLGVTMLRRGKGGAAAALLIGGLTMAAIHDPAPAYAQGEEVPNPFDVDAPLPPVPRDKDKDASAAKPDEVPNPFDVDKPLPSPPRDKDKDASAGKPEKDASAGTAEPAPVDEEYARRLAEAEGRINDLNRQASANRAEIERLRMLVESDRQNEPDPSNLPPMPLTCRPPGVERNGDVRLSEAWENYNACGACYQEPLAKLDELMLLYERLRILYMSTADFVSEQLLIGDQAPKPHFLLDSAWQTQKASILESLNGTRKAYDDKWAEFNDRLTLILDDLGTCEANHNNNPMWRETEGRLFYQTIKASYQRTN